MTTPTTALFPSTPNISSLPVELLEHILVTCALLGSPTSIANLSETCRFFRDVVYHASDSHLWREIYLTTFDDPREPLKSLRKPLSESTDDIPFDWKRVFQDRIRATKLFRRMSRDEMNSAFDSPALQQSLDALLSSSATASIHPSTIAEFSTDTPAVIANRRKTCISSTLKTESESCNIAWLSNLLEKGLPEPLVHRLIGRSPTGREEDNLPYDKSIIEEAWEHTPVGKAFYHFVLQTGFVPMEDTDLDDTPTPTYYLRNTKIPTPVDTSDQRILARTIARHRVYNLRYLSESRLWGPYLPVTPIRPRISEPEEGTHTLSIPGNHNHSGGGNDPPDFSLPFIRALLSDFSVFFESHNILFGDDDDDDDDFVPDQSGGGEDDDGKTNTNTNDAEDGDEDEDGSSSEVSDSEVIDIQLTHREHSEEGDGDDESSHSDTSEPATQLPVPIFPPYPHQIRPDYAFLSAARMVVEDNLRERYGHKIDHEGLWPWFTSMEALDGTRVILERIRSLDGLRMGGAPSFWTSEGVRGERGWFEEEEFEDEEEAESGAQSVKEKEYMINGSTEDEESCEGWDWAGAEGKWMRAVAWMDYRDLLFHNVRTLQTTNPITAGARLSEDLQETIRVFPMHIKVTGYSRVPPPKSLDAPPSPTPSTSKPPSDRKGKGKAKATEADTETHEVEHAPYDPLVYALPVIHITGEYRGSDVDEHAQRRCRGTVRMIGDRAVRWNLITSDVSTPEHDEWVMEGVQVGGIGSKIGVVGMWTGAEHERGDPIGPSWAWKMD
ncbi:hypothetical protein V5O48_004582 [Marasmius crinis-equi]|uniref:F-box domain-containing protein n=1 Tax=Marasmius crinis-equi TaxID=585013 RepID=A0ABR3FPS1_9AGAR